MLLSEESDCRIEVVTGDVYFTPSMVTDAVSSLITSRSTNILLFGRRLLWQRGALEPALRAKVTVLEVNPRAAVSWAVAILRAVLGRRTVG